MIWAYPICQDLAVCKLQFITVKVTSQFADPVEKIKLQIKDVDGAVSMQPIVQGDKPVKVKPGQYEVSYLGKRIMWEFDS